MRAGGLMAHLQACDELLAARLERVGADGDGALGLVRLKELDRLSTQGDTRDGRQRATWR